MSEFGMEETKACLSTVTGDKIIIMIRSLSAWKARESIVWPMKSENTVFWGNLASVADRPFPSGIHSMFRMFHVRPFCIYAVRLCRPM